MPQNESPAGALKMSRRIQRTPYTGRVESAGVRGFTVTNHMLPPKAYGNDMTRDDNPQFVAWGPNANAMPPRPGPAPPRPPQAAGARPRRHFSHRRAFANIRSHGPFSPQSGGCHECCTARITRSGCGIMIVTRPSGVVTPATPASDPFGLAG